MNKRVRNQILAQVASLSLLGLAAFPAYAAVWPQDWFPNLNDPCDVVLKIANFLVGISVIVAVIFFVVGGVQYMSSGGDKMAVEQARGKITGAAVGGLIAMAGYTILRILVTLLGGTIPGCQKPY